MNEVLQEITRLTPADRARLRAERRKLEKDTHSLKYILDDPRGRWFIMRLFEWCHMLDTTFTNEDHTNRMLVYEGERRVALNIQRCIIDSGELSMKVKAELEYYDFQKSMDNLIAAAEIERREQGDENI